MALHNAHLFGLFRLPREQFVIRRIQKMTWHKHSHLNYIEGESYFHDLNGQMTEQSNHEAKMRHFISTPLYTLEVGVLEKGLS